MWNDRCVGVFAMRCLVARRQHGFLAAALAVVVVLLAPAPARATVVVPVPDADLARQAAAIVVGTVTAIDGHWDPTRGDLSTHVTVAIHHVVKGDRTLASVVLKQAGGTVGDVHAWVDGSPEFTVGERALLFLTQNPDGTARVAHLYQGKFPI